MPSSRSWNRREFSITQNGYFTILKSNGWFSAVPLPGGFRYQVNKSKADTHPIAPTFAPQLNSEGAASQQATIQLQTIDSNTPRQALMRPALIVLAATALTWIGLWCTSHP
jgi:hypothetical protein